MTIFNFMISNLGLGGTEQVFIDYAKILPKYGHNVINITSTDTVSNKIFEPDHQIYTSHKNRHPWGYLTLLFLAIYYRPKLIICHENKSLRVSRLVRKLLGIKVLTIVHIYFYKRLERTDYIGSISRDITNYLIENGIKPERIYEVSNMIQITKSYCAKNIFNKKEIIIGGIGRFVPEKAFHHLIDAVKILKQAGYKITLLLAGIGPEINFLQNQVSLLELNDNIKFMGWVADKDEFYKQIDIFCLPSNKEPFGLVILEAMHYSLPVIATDLGGPKDIIENGINGFLVPQSGAAFAEKIVQLISQKNLAEELTKNAYNTLQNKFSPAIIGQNLSNIINEIINK